MEEAAGWIASAATMIAAMMTAANLRSRVTGWGFVIFLVGAIAWSMVVTALLVLPAGRPERLAAAPADNRPAGG